MKMHLCYFNSIVSVFILTILMLECFCSVNAGTTPCPLNRTRKFPPGFQWGVGSSAYQVEGAWDEDGKGPSIWDALTHDFPEKMPDRSNADITSDSYHQWRRDVQMVRELGVNIYRFSLSWPRILPTGFINKINKPGIDYYNNLINELIKYNITPMVTLYHWDLPLRFQELGGWTNPEMIYYFQDFARLAFKTYGDRVKSWTTFNEPWHVCEQAYGQDYMAPAINYPGIPSYLCGHNLLKAHAEVVHMYRNQFKPQQKGIIGITTDISYPQPIDMSPENIYAQQVSLQFYVGWFAHPIFSKTGNYPKIMIDLIGGNSKKQGYSKSRLPVFTKEEIERIKGTADFFGINSYTSVLVRKNDKNNSANHPIPSFFHDANIAESFDPTWPKSGSEWLHVVPNGMYNLLKWINREYDNPNVIVTENGVSDKGGTNDLARIDYFNAYLEAILDAIDDGCKVTGYIAWSLMDSFEWRAGFTEKFGLYHVDFNSPNRTRTAKASAKVFSNIAKTNAIDYDFRPQPDVIIPSARRADEEIKSSATTTTKIYSTIYVILTVCFIRFF